MSNRFSGKTMACVLAVLLWTLPLVALPNAEVIGKVVGSESTSVGEIAIPNGGTILNNDLLTTGRNGKALLQLSPANRVCLSENTTVRFARKGMTYFGGMSSGTLVAESRGPESLVVETPKYKIEPAGAFQTIYFVAMMPNRSTVVAANDGEIAITEISSGLKYILPEGRYASIPAASSGVPGSQIGQSTAGTPTGKPPKPPWHIGSLSHLDSEVVVGVIAGTAAAIAIPVLATSGAAVSPSAP